MGIEKDDRPMDRETTRKVEGLATSLGWHKEDQDNSVINALKRLERAGSEDSKTTQKLIGAADRLADHICGVLSDFVLGSANLPRGYFTVQPGVIALAYQWTDKRILHYVGHCNADRETALHFAHDIATGWLDELAEWVEVQEQGNAEAAAKLRRAAKAMEADREPA